jgi:hypothetical protein
MSCDTLSELSYDFNIITRKHIPENIFVWKNKESSPNDRIQQTIFSNGYESYIFDGSVPISDIIHVVEILESEYSTFGNYESPQEIQNYFYYEHNNYIEYDDCVKIFNQYHDNKSKIEEILEYYKK